MAREYAQVKLSIWLDEDYRDLSPKAQHLYFVLLTAPSLTFCGVADWRPKRLSALSKGWTPAHVEQAAQELITAHYLVVDDTTEEVLIRSFIRHDGLMKQPNMAVAMVSAYSSVASKTIRGAIADEVWRLSIDQPELPCWGGKASKDLLAAMIEHAPSRVAQKPFPKGVRNPFPTPSGTTADPLFDPIDAPSFPTPAPAPAPSSPTETASGDAPAAPETEGQRINRIARLYTAKVKLTKFLAVSGCVKAALRSGDYTEAQIIAGIEQLAEERRVVTLDSLRVAIEGMPPPTRRTNDIPRPGSGTWDRLVTAEEEQ